MNKKWTLKEAKKDYYKTHPKKDKEKKDCCDSEFSEMDWEKDVYCCIKGKFITLFTGMCARRCKYYQNNQ